MLGLVMQAMPQKVSAEADPNFFVYLCFGQSNMEGNAQWEERDNDVDPRFKMLATADFTSPKRSAGLWYTAECPIVSPMGGLGVADYFGRTMVAALPSDVKVGVVAVAMGGSPIEAFDKNNGANTIADNSSEWWAKLANNYYGGNPYLRLMIMGRRAQKVGVIKGILLHQGCSNNGDPNWPQKVKAIYEDLLADLNLRAEDVPLFVGETAREEMWGACYAHNTVVAKMPEVVPTSHVVSSEDIPTNDSWHFTASGYRTFGKRYAFEALKVMGRELVKDADYELPENLKIFFTLSQLDIDTISSVDGSRKIIVKGTFADNRQENLTNETSFTSDDFELDGNVVSAEKEGTVTATYTDFTGEIHAKTIHFDDESTTEESEDPLPDTNDQTVLDIGSTGKGTYCSEYDLDFTNVDGIKAYTATGYDDDTKTIWLSRVMRVPAGTGIMVKGDPGEYRIPHAVVRSVYANFFVGNLDTKITINETDGDETNYYMKNGQFVNVKGTANISTNRCYLQLPSSVFAGTRSIEIVYDDETTGIRDNKRETITNKHDDQWYSISGQRISQPTTKGLYIHHGRKVIIR